MSLVSVKVAPLAHLVPLPPGSAREGGQGVGVTIMAIRAFMFRGGANRHES